MYVELGIQYWFFMRAFCCFCCCFLSVCCQCAEILPFHVLEKSKLGLLAVRGKLEACLPIDPRLGDAAFDHRAEGGSPEFRNPRLATCWDVMRSSLGLGDTHTHRLETNLSKCPGLRSADREHPVQWALTSFAHPLIPIDGAASKLSCSSYLACVL